MTDAIRIGTRGSPLAIAQTEEIIAQIRRIRPGTRAKTVVIKTHGDEDYRRDLGTPLDGKRAFTKRIEDALLAGEIDFAVHSLKDLPANLVDGLVVAAVPPRADPRDVLIARDGLSLDHLPVGARIGTSSLRRRAQLLARWPGLTIAELHGNVGTRLRRLDAKEFDAIVLAAAGLARLKIRGPAMEAVPPDVLTPAPGQGALAVEAREEDAAVRRLLGAIEDPAARAATDAERALSRVLGGSCNVPFGALATVDGWTLTLRAVVASPDGTHIVRALTSGSARDWEETVGRAAGTLLDGGAKDILREVA